MSTERSDVGGHAKAAPVAFLDTETLGLDPDHNPVWEVGLILPDGAECLWHVQVTAREKALAHPIALEIGRFEERYGRDAHPITRAELAYHLCDRIPKGTHLAGAVISFDEERLRRLMWAEGLSPRWHYHLIDVEALAAGWLIGTFSAIQEVGKNPDADGPTQDEAMRALPPWDSNALSLALGVDPEDFDRHTALGDARWAKAIYERVMGP